MADEKRQYSIPELRARNNLTQEELGEMIGAKYRQRISYIEKDPGSIKAKTLARLARALNVSMDEIYIGDIDDDNEIKQ